MRIFISIRPSTADEHKRIGLPQCTSSEMSERKTEKISFHSGKKKKVGFKTWYKNQDFVVSSSVILEVKIKYVFDV